LREDYNNLEPSLLRTVTGEQARCYTWCMRDNNIIVEGMSLYGCSDVTCRGKVTCLQGVNDVGTGRETISCEKAAGVSLISSARC
jgi:hypothetical protein